MNKLLKAEFYKAYKSPIIIIAFFLPCMLPFFAFAELLVKPVESIFNNVKYTHEKSNIFTLTAEFLAIYSALFGLFLLINVVVIFLNDRQSKNLLYIHISYQNFLKVAISKLLYFLIYCFLAHLTVFLCNLILTKVLIIIRPELNVGYDFNSILLIFVIFLRIFMVGVGAMALLWVFSFSMRQFVILTPTIYILGSLADIKILPFQNIFYFYGHLLHSRKAIFSKDAKASIFNSLDINRLDYNSLVWVILSLLILFFISKKYSSKILSYNE